MDCGFLTTADEILRAFQPNGIITESLGPLQTPVKRISAIENCELGDLVFMNKKEHAELILRNRPSVVVTSPDLKNLFTPDRDFAVLIAPNLPLAHALIKQKYSDRDFALTGWNGVHPTAVIHETALIELNVIIEPGVVIGQNVKVGKDSRIMAGTIIENDVAIGTKAILHPRVVIGYGCRLGHFVEVGSGTVIGSNGFSYAQDAKKASHRIPQTGIVVLEDHVQIGACCSIDRAAYQETRIGRGTKLDNLCHVAHNVQIGEDCLLTAMFCVAGSTKIGNRVMASGQVGVFDHKTICDDTILLHRAGVVHDIDTPGAYAAMPAQPLKEYLKNAAAYKELGELRKRLRELEKNK